MTDEAAEEGVIGVIPAGFWRRVAAWVIDTIIVLVGTYLVGSFLWPDLVETTTHVSESDGARLEVVSYALSWLGSIVFGIALGVYTALQEAGRAQATIGKRMLGLRVTGLDGGRISLLTALLRCWPLWLPGLVSMVVGLNFVVGFAAIAACLAVPFTRRKQGLHDMLVRCLVVRRPPRVI
ncbi:MAG: RDD family protein [Rhodospirillales bacterium]|nr:RDD family protein [Rhodospirillales bacterium]